MSFRQYNNVERFVRCGPIYAQRIRSLCEKHNISINQLASLSGVGQSSIDNIVNGRTDNPGILNLHKIAKAFNMTLAEFLNFKELNEFSFTAIDKEKKSD